MKTFLIIIIILAVIGIVSWWWIETMRLEPSAENYNPPVNNQVQQEDDTTAVINSDLQAIDVGSIEPDFQAIDKEINNL